MMFSVLMLLRTLNFSSASAMISGPVPFLNHLVPKTKRHTCIKGETFSPVESVSDLKYEFDHEDLACLFEMGNAPIQLPEKDVMFEGKVLNIVRSKLWQPLAETLWKGKRLITISCDSGTRSQRLITNDMIGKTDYFYAEPRIGYVELPLLEGEAPLHADASNPKPFFIIDYRSPLKQYCRRDQKDYEIDQFAADDLYLAGVYPYNTIVDLIRVVGEDPQGKAIMLGRTLIQDWVTGAFNTIAYFTLEADGLEYPPIDTSNHEVPKTYDHQQLGFHDQTKIFWGVGKDDEKKMNLEQFGHDGIAGSSPWSPEHLLKLMRGSIEDWLVKLPNPMKFLDG